MYCSPVFQAQNSPKKPKILAGVLTLAITCLKALAQRLRRAFFLRKKDFLFRHIFALGNSLRKKLVLFFIFFVRKLSPTNIIIYKGVNQKILETKNKEEKEMKLRKILLASTLSIALAITAAVPAFAETEEAVPISADTDMPIMVQSQNIKTVLPKLTAKSYSYSKIKLSWDKVDGASGYQIYRATKKSGKYARIATVSAEKTAYINTKLTCGKTYYYKLRAYQVKNDKKVYSKYSTKISCYAKPNKVKNVNADYDNNWGIRWSKVSGASGYQLQYNRSGEGWKYYWRTPSYDGKYNGGWVNIYAQGYDGKNILDNGTKKYLKTTQAVWDLGDEGTSMSFRVRAYKTVNGKKVFGLYSEPVTIEPVWKSGKQLQDFVHTWVDENYPTYDLAEAEDYATRATPENASWGTTWTWCIVSQYETKESILEHFCESMLKDYFDVWWGLAEETRGILYTRDMGDGTWRVWWLG